VTTTQIPSKYATANAWATANAQARPHVPAASPQLLPHFSDWRVAYLGLDGVVHAVTLDGKTDVKGPALPDLTMTGLNVNSAGVGPDGKLLAYGADYLNLVDLTGQTPPRSLPGYGGGRLLWSPDGSELYAYYGGGDFAYISLPSGQATNVSPEPNAADEVGWIDNTHLAAVSYQGASYGSDGMGDTVPTSATLVSLDITTKQVRSIATMQGSGPAVHQFVISPDRTQALYFDGSFRSAPFTPQAALINLATGGVTPLPAIAATLSASPGLVVWRPGTNTLAVVSSVTGSQKTWLVDVGRDSATPVAATGYPMGWVPDNGPLVLSSAYGSSIGQGPYTLTALSCTSGTQCSTTMLTDQAMTFAFLGFIRNP
jgi:hypothetical protein